MVKTNEAAVKALTQRGWMDSTVKKMVEDLVDAGLIQADPDSRTMAEQLADAARIWVDSNPGYVFSLAAGWSTGGWQHVANEQGIDIKFEHYPENLREIFNALVLLAKDAGREL